VRLWTRSSTPAPATESQRDLSRCRRHRHGEDGKQQARSGRREDERENESSRWTTWCCRERFVNLHFHCVFLEGVYLDRTDQGFKPRFVKAEPPSDTGIAAVVQKISHRVMRMLRRLGYLEAGLDASAATGYDPLRDDAPELARTLAASVRQCIAFGERAGERVRRLGSGFGVEGEAPTLTGTRCASVQGFSLHANTQVPAHRRDQLERLIHYTACGAVSLERLAQDANGDLVYTFTHPWSDGTTGIRLSPLELLEKLAALVPLPRVHLVRYGGCLASHSHLRGSIIPTPRQQGVDEEETDTGVPPWSWARLLKRVFALDVARCPWCQRGGAADRRRHHAGRGHPEDPPASETFCRPTSSFTGPCPPGSLRLVLRLTVPRVSQTRLRPLPWGRTTPPSPAPSDFSPHTAHAWGDAAVRCPRLPSEPHGCPCATSLALATSCTLAYV
jgi:hypothetical protein